MLQKYDVMLFRNSTAPILSFKYSSTFRCVSRVGIFDLEKTFHGNGSTGDDASFGVHYCFTKNHNKPVFRVLGFFLFASALTELGTTMSFVFDTIHSLVLGS
jgi:hypothetical protein